VLAVVDSLQILQAISKTGTVQTGKSKRQYWVSDYKYISKPSTSIEIQLEYSFLLNNQMISSMHTTLLGKCLPA